MTENHRLAADGVLEDGVSTRPATAAELAGFDRAEEVLSQFRAPVLYRAEHPNERLFVACFDGTWNDMREDPEHTTNVGLIARQLDDVEQASAGRIHSAYVDGIGTDGSGLQRAVDGAIGFSYDARLETMYEQLMVQARRWKQENPDAEIRIVDLGFSRGAEEAAGFARLVHQRGIADPTGYRRFRGDDGQMHVEFTKPPLVATGAVAQAEALFDPVGTGHPRAHDRRPPASVISGFQLVAADERRNLFQSTSIMDPGQSHDGRFLSVTVPGAHSDVGGGYHRNGLAMRSSDLMADYINGLTDPPLLQKQLMQADPRLDVIHRSEEGAFFYRTSVFDAHGERGRVEALAPRGTPGDRFNAEPRDEALASRFEFRAVAIGPLPQMTSRTPDAAATSETALAPQPVMDSRDRALHAQALDGVRRLDAELGRTPDTVTERAAAALLAVAREAGLERIDRVVRSDDGRHLFAVQGELASPTNRWARVDSGIAANTPVATSLQALATLNAEIERRTSVAHDGPTQTAPNHAPPPPARTIGAH